MNILVMGAGTVGSIVGGYLTGSGYNVTLVDGWSANVDVLNREGLKLSGTRGEHHFPVKAVMLEELSRVKGPFGIIFISVKTYDTALMAEYIRPLLSAETVIISTQNGINEEFLAAEFGRNRVIGAVTEMSGYMVGPGNVVETRKDGGFVLGELDGSDTPRLQNIASVMAGCGHIKLSNNIMGILWSKLIWNSMMNPLTAISGFGTGRILQHDRYRMLALEVGMEGFAVSSKHHIRLEPLTLMGINPRRLDAHQPREVQAEGMALKLLPEPLDKMPSMAQDIKNGRLTEIDYINGILVEWGKKLAVPTPVNEEIVKTVHAIEEKQKTQSPALLDAMIEKLGLRRDGK
jgi:2-dehydropantoate 2-reductase